MIWAATVFGVLSGATWSPESPTSDRATGRDLQAACSSAMAGQFRDRSALDGEDCVWIATVALMNHAGRAPEDTTAEGAPVSFCLPDTSIVSIENVGPLIEAYLEQYRRDDRAFSETSARAAFLTAMQRQWPCPGRR
jgi:hypothetical protein